MMSPLDNLNDEQKECIEEFRKRMRDTLPPEKVDDTLLYYRFLKARDFNIDKAEFMLRKNLVWRKANQVDTILDTYSYSEVFKKYLQPSLIGFDKIGDIVRYLPGGKVNPKDVPKCTKLSDYTKSLIYFMENEGILLKKENEKRGRKFYQTVLIFDLDGLTYANTVNKITVDLMLKFCKILIDNYPESMKAVFVINAPAYYVFIYNIVSKLMSNAQRRKVHIYGQVGWKEALLNIIDPEVLPAFLGGNRTDPDGNPLCLTSICHGDTIPTKYYLTDEDRWFKDSSEVEIIAVPAMAKSEVSVDVKSIGSLIQWEFKASKDIGFGIFLEDPEKDTEIIPIQKYDTSDGTEIGCYKAQSTGKYVIVFDNSYSWLRAKEVYYCITVK